MGDMSRIQFVVGKYRLSEITNVALEVDGKPLGPGPIMDPSTVQEFVRRDPSGNCKYLEWMVFIAGGGQDRMEAVLNLWHGIGPNDHGSLRAQSREDFIQERMAGYTENGVVHPPVSLEDAVKMWDISERSNLREIVMGDQDVAAERGYGFYRYWPGKDNLYLKIVNAVKLWHASLPALKADNERRRGQVDLVNAVLPTLVDLDIYAGWKPSAYSQKTATYKNLSDLLGALSSVRKLQMLRDTRHEVIFEDDKVLVLCPLTVGASVKYGSYKWCTANRSEFERGFDPGYPALGHWTTFTQRGPLVYYNWKIPMPEWLSKIAIHINKEQLRKISQPQAMGQFFDVQNHPGGTTYAAIVERIKNEHGYSRHWTDKEAEADLRWAGRTPGTRAWPTSKDGTEVLFSFYRSLAVVTKWASTFDCKRVESEYNLALGEDELVDKV